ncbi:carbohydrate ABC transporter permease [Pollutimonas bauzanensis]|uniref:Carbohydrate ABC transporter membrane protein 1, CUT1 family n=1 Tax=Pollutimonas bauzanensis TaxID=658167 RepID=A0A1M5Z8R7_9BURK|nr:sugar ABC transporter permease [Pollutimonas bauzanensis]SHI20627.1 carbohydrate ABC transporter membrane protein 1, CUT1 family [Pollutimonas bauzanensis]
MHVSNLTARRSPAGALMKRASPYLLLVPAAAFVLLVTVYPIISLFYTAFHSTNYFQVGGFSGLANFAPLFSASGAKSFTASAVFVIASDILTVSVALCLALVMEAPLRKRGLLRTFIMLPWLVSMVVTSLLWQAMLDPNFGPITHFAHVMFGWNISLLSDETSAMAVLVLANVWRSYPFALVLILAALQSIPDELYEAARLDGASRWTELRHIALPLAGRTILVVLILLTFEYFTLVTLPFIMTSGGPNEATYLLSLRIWREAFTNYQFGLSAATGVVVFLLNLALSGFYIYHFVLKGSDNVSR